MTAGFHPFHRKIFFGRKQNQTQHIACLLPNTCQNNLPTLPRCQQNTATKTAAGGNSSVNIINSQMCSLLLSLYTSHSV